MENAFEMSLRTLFEANRALVTQDAQRGPGLQYTLLDIMPLLTNVNFCHSLLQEISDDYLHRWWREYYEPLSPVQQRDVINPIAAKVAKFESLIARRILGQGASTLNIPQLINERKIILFKLARGIVGNEVASMIGATLLGLIQNTLEEQERPKHIGATRLPIMIDEFHRVAGADYRTLSELHKYGATFFLATQSLEYLQKVNALLWPTLQANVRQTIAFNMSAQDASLLSKELGVDQEDILHLDINTCYVSVLAANRRQPTFSLQLNSPSASNVDMVESIRIGCRLRYTNPVAEVDKKLSEAMLHTIRKAPRPDRDPVSQPPSPQRPALPDASANAMTLPFPPFNEQPPFALPPEPPPAPPTEAKSRREHSWPSMPLPLEAHLEGAEYRQRRDRESAWPSMSLSEGTLFGGAEGSRSPAGRSDVVYRPPTNQTQSSRVRNQEKSQLPDDPQASRNASVANAREEQEIIEINFYDNVNGEEEGAVEE